MTEGERIRAVRTELKMTMEQFGAKVGVTKVAISNLEKGNRSVTEQMRMSLCRTFNINYDWLISGEGSMFTDLPATVLDELCRQYDLDDLDRSLIAEYLKLDARDRQVLKDYIRNVMLPRDDTQARIDREVEAYRRELELEASQAAQSSASGESAEKLA